jgi:RND family efflux transporter MFP subunit
MAFLRRLAVLGLSAGLICAADAQPRPVRTQKITLTPAEQAMTYSGTIQARVQADLAFRVGGKIIDRPVNPGDRVKEGQLLARLDPADLRLSLDSAAQAVAAAAADAMNARADLSRYRRLGTSSPAFLPAELDKREAAVAGDEARLAQARRQMALARDQLAYAELRADADGLVAALPMQVGQVVQAGQTVATLAHAREIEAVVDVPENRVPDIRAADTVTVALWSDPEKALPGRVREIGALADAASRTYQVKVTITDPAAQGLGLGMTATVRFAHRAGAPLALLPATALADAGGSPAVWVLDPAAQRASLRKVTLASISGDGMIAISAGLRGGEDVVTAGTSELRPDLPVAAWSGPLH